MNTTPSTSALSAAIRICRAAILASGLLVHGAKAAPAANAETEPPRTLRIAVVQMRSVPDLAANVAKVREHLAACAQQGVQLAVFPECALSTYYADFARTLDAPGLTAAENGVAAACREHGVNAIVGTAEVRDGRFYNCALFINASGEIVARHRKLHLVPGDTDWQCQPGTEVAPVVFLAGVPCSVVICHDIRYPELCRVPVLAGARVVCYISHEAAIIKEHKLGPYRAQVQARAAENSVFVAHANAPADDLRTGSHGQSRLVDPDGNVIKEASMLREEVLVADLPLAQATAAFSLRSLEREPLASWWRQAVSQVRIVP
jgi:predicted amidohydrolase